jgi:hypothetical protein
MLRCGGLAIALGDAQGAIQSPAGRAAAFQIGAAPLDRVILILALGRQVACVSIEQPPRKLVADRALYDMYFPGLDVAAAGRARRGFKDAYDQVMFDGPGQESTYAATRGDGVQNVGLHAHEVSPWAG